MRLLFICVAIACYFKAQAQQTVNNGATTTAITSPGTGCTYTWTNDHPEIGLPASGTGTIPSFTAVNTGSSAITATIKVTPNPSARAYALGYDNITVIDTKTDQVVTSINNLDPFILGGAVNYDGSRVYVGSQGADQLTVINTFTNQVMAKIPLTGTPFVPVVSPDNKRVYVGLVGPGMYSGIDIIDATNNTRIGKLLPAATEVFKNVEISPDGKLLYLQNLATLRVIDLTTQTVIHTFTMAQSIGGDRMVITKDGSRLYLTDQFQSKFYVISATDGSTIATLPIPGKYFSFCLSPDGKFLYLPRNELKDVAVINTIDYSVSTIPVSETQPFGISITPDGKKLYLVSTQNYITAVVDIATKTVIAKPASAQGASYGNFIIPGIACSDPVTYTITVNGVGTTAITVTGNPSALNTTYGTASASTSFNISASGLTTGVLVTPPYGFEVSSDNINFSATVLMPSSGAIDSRPVYIRLSGTANAGSWSGNIILSSPGAADVPVDMPLSIINKALLTITATNQTHTVAEPNPVFTASYDGFVNNDTQASLIKLATITTTARVNSPPGIYSIDVSDAEANNYTFKYVAGILTVTRVTILANSFTPNGDGVNDFWILPPIYITPRCVVAVFNRFGQQVFASVGYSTPWDGTYKGVNVPAGTYYYSIDPKNGVAVVSGSVTVIR